MRQISGNDKRPAAGGRGLAALLAAGLASGGLGLAAPAAAIPVEPLVVRVQDAEGAPGEQTAIVFRTYASRPVRRGRIASVVTPVLRTGRVPVNPIQSCDAVVIFSVNGDVTTEPCAWTSGSLDAVFQSLSATINANDGVFGAIYVTLAATVVPGDQYSITIDDAVSYLDDPELDPVPLAPRAGSLNIRAASDPVSFSVDGGKVEPGSGAVIEVGTVEPFDLQAGRLLLTYDPAIATELPVVITDPRHGDVSVTVTYPQAGRVQVDFTSALETFNRVPGDLLILHFGTPPGVPVGTMSPLGILTGPNQSSLIAPGSMPLQVAWGAQGIEFQLDPGIFNDGFDGGDSGFWSYVP